jgi:hypothetical protein
MQIILLFMLMLGAWAQGSKPIYTQVTYIHDLERFRQGKN